MINQQLPLWRRQANSFYYAAEGMVDLLRNQPHARFHALATALVIVAGLVAKLSRTEWCLLILSITLVWVAEALNTAVEYVTDLASPEIHPLAKKAKDVAAGAVLCAALGAAGLGLIIFWPHFF